MARIANYIKNIFFILLILQFLPPIIGSLRKHYSDLTETKSHVGVIPIKGVIMDTQGSVHQVRKFFKDPKIKAIVIKIDSPGGSPAACQEFFNEVKDLKKEYAKPVFAYAENFCTSGGYYIACAADHIIAQPATLVGSVGVYIGFPNFQDFLDNLKIKYTTIETGTHKAASMIFKDITPDQKAMLQAITDDTYAQFVSDVIESRPQLAKLDKTQWAEGKTFTGKQGKKLGLIDELGSQSTLERALRSKAPVEGDIVWIHPPAPSALSMFFKTESDDFEGEMACTKLPALWGSAFARAALETFARPMST